MNNEMIRAFYSGKYDKMTIEEFRKTFESKQNLDDLKSLAKELGGSLENATSEPYIRIDTGDNTSKENYDDLISIVSELPDIPGWKIKGYWADHDTQIIEFTQRESPEQKDWRMLI